MSLVLPFAGLGTIPDEAAACSSICSFKDFWSAIEPLNVSAIPIDGVLLLQGTESGTLSDAEWIAKIDLTVTRDGQPVGGALETSSIDNILIWRPDAPLEPGATFNVTGTLTNPDPGPEYYDCSPDVLMIDFDFTSGTAPSAPLVAPGVGAVEAVIVEPYIGLDDLVCCDEAFPYDDYPDCGGAGGVTWPSGFCASRRGDAVLRVQLTVDHDIPEPTAALVTRQVVTDGEPGATTREYTLTASAGQPICTEVILRNLATGESVTTPMQCHGDAVATQLGPRDLDPSDILAEQCSSPAYTCEHPSSAGWDSDQCVPWPPEEPTTGEPTGGPEATGDTTSDDTTTSDPSEGRDTVDQDGLGDHGCGCERGAPDAHGLLVLAGLGLLRRRRR